MDFRDFIVQLEYWGVADVLLPFLLVFTIAFAVMQKTKLLGDEKKGKRFHLIVSLVLGFSFIFPHLLGWYPYYSDPVDIVNRVLPNIAIIIIAVIMLLLMLGSFGKGYDVSKSKWLSNAAVIFSIVAVIYIFGTSAGWWGSGFPRILDFLNDPNTVSLIVAILVFGLIIGAIVSDPDKEGGDEDKGLKGFFKDLHKGYGGDD